MKWPCRDLVLELGSRTHVMGIVNVTPDSFSDGGRYVDPAAAVERALQLLAEGADLVDLGAESTRPGAESVPAAEQIRRLEPVLRALADRAPRQVLSVDTRSAEVAEAALALGARVINDVSALADAGMAEVAARSGAGLVLMHMRGTPRTMQDDTRYGDVVAEVAAALGQAAARAESAGVAGEAIVFDPGIGFGKSATGSLELLARLPELTALGRPVLVGASRKSFLARLTDDAPVHDRLESSLAAAVTAALAGARVLRVHDVRATVRALRVADAVRAARGAGGPPCA